MNARITDDELIRRLAELPPEEWSPAELESLRRASSDSARLRQALADHLELEETLHVALARYDVRLDLVFAHAEHASGLGGDRLWRIWGLSLAGLLVLAFIWLAASYLTRQPDAGPLAAVQPAAPSHTGQMPRRPAGLPGLAPKKHPPAPARAAALPDNRAAVEPLNDAEPSIASRSAGVQTPLPNPTTRTTDAALGHPLIVPLAEDNLDLMARIEAALAAGNYGDACRIIALADLGSASGLLPHGKDAELMLSFARCVALAVDEHPSLRQAMEAELGSAARQQVQQAMADEDDEAMQACAARYYGTQAAGEAHAWLADRALAEGRFSEACGSYRAALRHAPPEQRQRLSAHLRLAAAMLGRDEGEAPRQAVELGRERIEPSDFERLTEEMRQLHAGQLPGQPANGPHAKFVWQPPVSQALQASPWARWESARIVSPGNMLPGPVDPLGRCLAAVAAAGLLIVSDGQHAAAYDLESGASAWTATLSADSAQAIVDQPLPMWPLVTPRHTWLRLLRERGPQLVCLDTATGEPVWRNAPGDYAASDPLLIEDKLFVLVAESAPDRLLSLELAVLDAFTGEPLFQQPLVALHNRWGRRLECLAVAAGDSIIIAAGPATFACGLRGELHWLRRHRWYADATDRLAAWQQPATLYPAGDRIFVAHGAAPCIECLDVVNGQSQWRHAAPDVVRLIGLGDKQVVLRTAGGFTALAPESGTGLWYHDAEGVLEGMLCSAASELLFAQRQSGAGDRPALSLVCLDLDTGLERARWLLRFWLHSEAVAGPLVAYQDRLWGFFGRDRHAPTRELFELNPMMMP